MSIGQIRLSIHRRASSVKIEGGGGWLSGSALEEEIAPKAVGYALGEDEIDEV